MKQKRSTKKQTLNPSGIPMSIFASGSNHDDDFDDALNDFN